MALPIKRKGYKAPNPAQPPSAPASNFQQPSTVGTNAQQQNPSRITPRASPQPQPPSPSQSNPSSVIHPNEQTSKVQHHASNITTVPSGGKQPPPPRVHVDPNIAAAHPHGRSSTSTSVHTQGHHSVTTSCCKSSNAPPNDIAMSGSALFHNGRYVILTGGTCQSSNQSLNGIYCCDLQENRWLKVVKSLHCDEACFADVVPQLGEKLAQSNSGGGASSGTFLPGVLPISLFGHILVANGNSGWIIGGTGPNGGALRTAIRLTFEFPASLNSTSTAATMGTGHQGGESTTDHRLHEPSTTTVTQSITSVLPTNSTHSKLVVITSIQLYPLQYVSLFAASTRVISSQKHAPFVFFLGGLTAAATTSGVAYTNRVFAMDLEEITLHNVVQEGEVPTPRAAAAACCLSGTEGNTAPKIVLYGGRNATQALEDLYVGTVEFREYLGTIRIQWKKYAPWSAAEVWPGPRAGHDMTVTDGTFVIVTGGSSLATSGDQTISVNPATGRKQQAATNATTTGGVGSKVYVLSFIDDGCAWSEQHHGVNRSFHRCFMWNEGILLAGGSSLSCLRFIKVSTLALPNKNKNKTMSQLSSTYAEFAAFHVTLENGGSQQKENGATPEATDKSGSCIGEKEISLERGQGGFTLERLKGEIFLQFKLKGEQLDIEDLLLDYKLPSGERAPLHMPATLDRAVQECDANQSLQVWAWMDRPPTHYRLLRELGKGSFGSVHLAMNSFDNNLFAVKVVQVKNESNLETLRKEIRMMRQLKHDNIVSYLGSHFDREKKEMCIFMDFIPGGSLESLWKEPQMTQSGGGRCGLPIREVQLYSRQLLYALDFLHCNNIVHRDVKGANALLSGKGVVKLSDFGTAKHLNYDNTQKVSVAGTAVFMAPEVIAQTQSTVTPAADIWSLGCLVIELLNGDYPYAEWKFENYLQVAVKIGADKQLPLFPSFLTEKGIAFLNRCFQVDPVARPNAKELLQDPFILELEPQGVSPWESQQQAPSTDSSSLTTSAVGHPVAVQRVNGGPLAPSLGRPKRLTKKPVAKPSAAQDQQK